MGKAKRDPETELKRRKRIVSAFENVGAAIVLALMTGVAILALIWLYTDIWLTLTDVGKLLLVGLMCAAFLFLYYVSNLNRVEELEKIVEKEEKKFPPDILDRPIRHESEDGNRE